MSTPVTRIIREQVVILDYELALIYGTETRTLNQTLKRNSEFFQFSSVFQLTEKEWEQQGSLQTTGGRRYRPHAYTEDAAKQLCRFLKNRGGPSCSYPIKDLLINERILEEYIKTYPQTFLGMNLTFKAQQKKIGRLRPDLLFSDNGGKATIVEIQLGQLDRGHLYRVLEYRDLYKVQYQTEEVNVLVFCNGLSLDSKAILAIHNVELVERSEDVLYGNMKNADNFTILNQMSEQQTKAPLFHYSEMMTKITNLFHKQALPPDPV
jgi:hypothetical protein